MNKFIKNSIVFCFLLIIISSKSFGQRDTLFWFSAPETNRYHSYWDAYDCRLQQDGTPVYLHLTTFENAANVSVSMPANAWFTTINLNIPANTTQRVDLSSYVDDALVNEFVSMENKLRWTTSNLAIAKPFINKGTKGIKVSSDRDITAYYEIGVQYNMDLISLKGNNALGRQFFVPFQTTNDTRAYYCDYRPYSSIDIVATEDNTKILVTTDKAIWAKDGIPENKPAGTHVIWLDKGETSIITPYDNIGGSGYQTSFDKNDRLAGAFVEVDQAEGSGAPISVITHDDIVKSNNSGNPDYVTDQLVPIELIGTDYAVIQGVGYDITPPSLEIEDYTYVVGTVAGTSFTVKRGPGGATTNHTVGVGETVAIPMDDLTKQVITINSDNPVYVYHMSGAGRQKAGAIIPTISTCTGSYKVAFNRTKGGAYKFYLNILARTSAIGNFKLQRNSADVTDVNDLAVLAKINNINNYDTLPEIGDPYDEWRYARIDADDLTASDVVSTAYLLVNDTNFFHLGVINGNTSNDAFYGYFSNFNEITASAKETAGQAQLAQVCEGDTIFLEAEGGKKYHWTPHDYLDDPYSPTPSAVLPPGIYNYDVRIQGECNLDTTITIQLECLANPEAFFTLSEYKGCAPFNVEIQNKSVGADKFSWDFTNDASFDSITTDPNGNIMYSYNNTTSTDSVYTIRVVAREVGVICTDEYTNTLQVYPEINAAFSIDDSIGCNPLTVNFTDNSSGNLDKYQWVFDDGTTSNNTGNEVHEFSHVNTNDTAEFDVELRLTSPYFCRDTARKTIKVYPYLEGEFNIDKTDGCSPLEVTITNISAGEDTMDLDFGDTSPHYTPATFTSVTHTYTNTGTTVIKYPIELQAINDEGCVRIWRDTVTVYPEVQAAFNVNTDKVCNTGPVEFTRTSPNGTHIASEFLWTFGDGSSSDTATTLAFNKTYTNITNADQTLSAQLIAKSQYACADTISQDIYVYRAFADFVIDDDNGCSPLDVNITSKIRGDDTENTYQWVFNNGDAPSNLRQPTNPITYTNTTAGVLTPNLTLTVQSNSGFCTTTKTETLNVYPEIEIDKINVLGLQSICDSTNLGFSADILDAALPNVSYSWDFDDGSSASTNPTSHIFRNKGAAFFDRNVELIVETEYGCTDTNNVSIRVRPFVRALFTVDTILGCSPLTVNAVATQYAGIPAANYLWNFGDGAGTHTGYDPLAYEYPRSLPTAGDDTYTLRLDVSDQSGQCTDFMEKQITVYAETKADFDPQASFGCNPYEVTFDNKSQNSVSWQWNFDDGTSSPAFEPTHQFVNTGAATKPFDVTLSVESNNGCTHDTTATVNVYQYVNAYFDIDSSAGCSPLTVTIENNSDGTNFRWYWDSTNASGAVDKTSANGTEVFSHQYINNSGTDQIFNLTLVAENANNCTDTITRQITVHSALKAEFVSLSGLAGCTPFEVDFDNQTDPASDAEYFAWDFDDAITGNSTKASPDISHEFINNTAGDLTRTVELTATSDYGCTHDTTLDITVYSLVEADFSIDVYEGCAPLIVNIANNSVGTEFYWYWDDDDLTLANADNTLQNPGSTTYTLTTGGSRTDSLTLIVGNGHGCYDTLKRAIRVHSSLTSDFTITQPNTCNPSDVLFTDASLPDIAGYTYKWDFGDGTSAETLNDTITKTFTNSSDIDSVYTVRLDVESTNGCTSSVQHTLTVNRFVKADFDVDIIEDCSPLTVNISNNSHGGIYRWYWNSQTAAGAEDYATNVNSTFSHEYINTSGNDITFYLTLVAENANGCTDTLTKEILVHSSIDAQFTFTQPDSCNQSAVEFTNTSIGGNAYNLNWNFGDGSSLATTTNTSNKTYVNNLIEDQDFIVTLSAESENGCIDQYQDTVTVFSRLEADFSIPLKASCPPFENAVIHNTSIGNNLNTYEWFVDGVSESTVTGKSPFVRTYDNTDPVIRDYSIRLLATNPHGCTSEKIETISVYERVVAEFSMDIVEGCTPLKVGFDNQSQKTTDSKYLWNFGDGATSAEFEPSVGHTFYNTSRQTDKPYTISLQVTSENYCTHDTTGSILINHQPLAKFFIDKTSSCPPLVTGLDKGDSEGETVWEWRFGDGSAVNTTDESFSHTYQSTGVGAVDNYKLELWVGTAEGCMDSSSLTVNVFPSVTADFNFSTSSYCSPAIVDFTDNSSSWVKNYEWQFRDGNASNLQNPQNRYENTGVVDREYEVYLRVSSEYNCWDTISKPLTVYVQPKANFYVDPVLLKFPENVVGISNNTNFGPFDYLWEFGDLDASTSTVEQPGSFEYDYWGEKVINLSVESQTNASCKDTYSDTILIMAPEVNADFTANITEGCLDDGLDVIFSAKQSAYNETYLYEWDFGDGSDTEDGQIVTHTYTEAGVYSVQLTARSQEAGIKEDYEYETITVHANPVAGFNISPDKTMIDPSTLKAGVNFYNLTECNDTAGCTYLWDFGDGETAISSDRNHFYAPDPDDFVELEDGTMGIRYTVKLVATTSHGCEDSYTVENGVTIYGAGQIVFPNAFTPDGLGPSENETFKPVYEGVMEYELFIYNRWGELIFTTKDLDAGWNGTINGDIAKPEVYVWKAKGKFTNGRAFEIAGDVTLIR